MTPVNSPSPAPGKGFSLASEVAQLSGLEPNRMPRAAYLLAENIAAFSSEPEDALGALGAWLAEGTNPGELPFHPTRILMQDTAGVAALADLAALRDAARRRGLPAESVDSAIPIDLVIDHSVHVERSGTSDAMAYNMAAEMARNAERYGFFKWAEDAFSNLTVVPPGQGICHQINLEQLASIAVPLPRDPSRAICGTVIGTDSHTTMVNALGILGWGVGGMEAEVAALAQPLMLAAQPMTRVVLEGRRQPGVAAADLALAVTRALREAGVVSEFVEFGGPALDALSLPDRAAIANMCPEYGAFCGLFPVDETTLAYLAQMNRSARDLALYEAYARETGLWRNDGETRLWHREVGIDISGVGLSMAGPRRPHEQRALAEVPAALAPKPGETFPVAIAAITSCTNTANPESMIAAGLIARAARARGLRVPDHVKTSLAPGSRRIAALLEASGLQADLDALGFHIVGFGCTTCVGNSGELLPQAERLRAAGATLCSVLSGNRNFEGRIHPQIESNWLTSPALVVVAALAGSLERDLSTGPIGRAPDGTNVFLKDIWPDDTQVAAMLREADIASGTFGGTPGATDWEELAFPSAPLFPWDTDSLYLQPPPFFEQPAVPLTDLSEARVLLALGDNVTTDHISPVGRIDPNSPAGRYIHEAGGSGQPGSYGAYRANHTVMTLGTFAHPHLSNRLAAGPGPWTAVAGPGQVDIVTASEHYRAQDVPTVILAGARYGMGSARDWAAKGTRMLGVRAVLAVGFERIHRANLIGAGVMPIEVPEALAFHPDLFPESTISIGGLSDMNRIHQPVRVSLTTPGGRALTVEGRCRIDTPTELAWIRAGGVFALARDRVCNTD
ncbi:aconitate hydratase AcnA [uncultured Roseibium sp.]|uniref:aconitate hydratase AcnA n=1 Tax=uncultured Roseibium sp. TaxID=1936171 RepID=UPI003216785F